MTTPVETAPQRRPLREIFGWPFWLNYAFCLVLTVWIPLVQVQLELNGKLQGEPQRLPMYNIYGQLWKHPEIWAPWKFAIYHFGITFAVMATVWWLLLRRAPAKSEPTPESPAAADE